jgi:hypothetical protein
MLQKSLETLVFAWAIERESQENLGPHLLTTLPLDSAE